MQALSRTNETIVVVNEVDCFKPWVLVPRTTHSVPRLKTRSVSLRNLVDQASEDVPNEFCQSNKSNDVINIIIFPTGNNSYQKHITMER